MSNSGPAGSLLFLRSFLTDPRRIGALAPSSPHLARLMASHVHRKEEPVLEVGAGTGVITQALLDAGVSPSRLFIIERDRFLARFLRQQFNDVHIICGDAVDAEHLLRSRCGRRAGTVVSSLPLRSLTPESRIAVLRGMLSALDENGHLLQFTYAAGCPVKAHALDLEAKCLGRVWRNLPPAAVWSFRPKRPAFCDRTQ